ncbi:MAG TPA: hypothetical protein PKI00_01320 [Candidatus Pacearchaeota archaeon]|nr:hypothetical protein [Candidatus Pacearchaeota archaeon]
MENNIIFLIIAIFIILILNIFYLFHKIKKQTREAKKEFESYLEKKIQLFLELIEEIRKYAKLSQKIENSIKQTVGKIKESKGFKDKKHLNSQISSTIDSILNSISIHSERVNKIKGDLKEIELGMDSFKSLWLYFLGFFRNKKKEEVFEEKRVKVKIKKKK